MKNRTCDGCRFWHQAEPAHQSGRCLRYPPVANAYGHATPAVTKNNYCGEWRDKSITPEQERRAELVTQFALAVVQSGADVIMHDVWRMAAEYADAKPKIGGES